MYNFVDTIEVSDGALLPAEALQINGEYIENLIPGYRTLSVSGREALSPEIETYETGIRDGATVKSKRYPERIIIVKYRIIAADAAAFRAAYNKLGGILDVEDAELIFNDETDKFYIGTPAAIGEVEPGKNAVIGEFEILCADPFKYSVEEYEAAPDADGNFTIEYNGTYKSYPVLEAAFYDESEASEDGITEKELTGAGDCGYVAFFNEREKIIQLGDPEEVDGEDLPASQLLLHWDFMTANKWGAAAQKAFTVNNGITSSSAVEQKGTPGTKKAFATGGANDYYLTAADYGSGENWHGPSITRVLRADETGDIGAANCTASCRIKLAIGEGTTAQKELGGFQYMLVTGSGSNRKIVAGFTVYKGSYGKTAKLRFYVNNKTVHTMDIDLSLNNKYFGNNIVENKKKGIKGVKSVKTCIVEKIGNKVSFNVGGVKKVFTVVSDANFAALPVHEVTYTFFEWKNSAPLTYNGLYYLKFTKHNCDTWRDVPNKFNSADVITADCSTGEIYLNDAPTPEYGALGNDWEEFYLKPGFNQVGVAYSDFVESAYAPTFKMRYREVFL